MESLIIWSGKWFNIWESTLQFKIDCSNNYISQVELGKVSLSLTKLIELSNILGESLEYFLVRPEDVEIDTWNDSLNQMFNSLNHSNRVVVRKMIEYLLESQSDVNTD